MNQLLGLVILSFFVTGVFMVPFIDLLFILKRKYGNRIMEKPKTITPIHDQLMKGDEQTPSGGGILLIAVLVVMNIVYILISDKFEYSSIVLLFTLVMFGLLGGIDDVKQLMTIRRGKFLGLGRRFTLFMQIILSLIAAFMLYFFIGINNFYIPLIGNLVLGVWYVPIAALVIVTFANAYNISDGLDGLSAGLLMICLFAFLAIAAWGLDIYLASFIGLWIGALFAFLYFNIWPARIFLGDAGAFAFGATLAVVGLLTGKALVLPIIGGMFMVILTSSLLQIVSKKILHKKIFVVAPIHMMFKYIGWPEAKVVTRFWLIQALLAIFGVWIAFWLK